MLKINAEKYSVVWPEHPGATCIARLAGHAATGRLIAQIGQLGAGQQGKNDGGVGLELAEAARESGPSYEKKDDLFIFCLSDIQTRHLSVEINNSH